MASEWREIEIGKYAKVQGGFAFKGIDFKVTGIPVVKIKNVKERVIDLDDCGFVDEVVAIQTANYSIKSGNVLISMTGSGASAPNSLVGRVARHNGHDDEFLINQRVGRFLIKDKARLDERFLYYYLSPKERQWEFVAIATGSANQVNISAKQIESFCIKLPPLPEQKAIAHILGSLDDKIELNRQMNQTLEQMAQAMFKSWFVDFDPVIDNALAQGNEIPEELQPRAEQRLALGGKRQPLPEHIQRLFPSEFEFSDELDKWVPKGWRIKEISTFGSIICGKTPPKKIPENYNGEYPFIKIPNMHNEIYAINPDESISAIGASTQSNKLLPPGTVCVSCIATVGKVILTHKKCFTNQQINSIIPHSLPDRYFLYFEMLSNEKLFNDIASSGSATLNMNTSTFKRIKLLTPPIVLRTIFGEQVKDNFDNILVKSLENEDLIKLRDTLLPKLISGEVRVGDFGV